MTLPAALVDDTAQDLEQLWCPVDFVEYDQPA